MNASQTRPESSASPLTLDTASQSVQSGHAEATTLREQLTHGNIAGLREYLARTRQACAWQDRILTLDALAPIIPLDVLETICAIDPDSADLAVVRCAYYSADARLLRGSSPLDQVSEASLRKAALSIRTAVAALESAVKFDPEDPTPFACIVPALAIFDQLKGAMHNAFLQATSLAPELTTLLSFGTGSSALAVWPN